MLTGKRLQDYLAYTVHGKTLREKPERKPPAKARTPIPKKRKGPPRKGPERSEPYKAWIRTLPCLACGIEGQSEAAHTGTDGGMRMKASDFSCVPLCPNCHTQNPDAYHTAGGKAKLETRIGRTFASACAELRAEWESIS